MASGTIYTVYTYGGGEMLETLFNAVAALLDSKNQASLYSTLIRLGLMVGMIWALLSVVYGNFMKMATTWFIPFYAMITLLFAPTTSITIKDISTGELGISRKVDHVPWGLGAFAGTISSLSHVLTRKIEAAFSLPDDLKYHKTGAMMASSLIADARVFHITNTRVADSMKDFVNQCVVYSALLGTKYTMDDLKNTHDIWNLVKAHASPARSFTFYAPEKSTRPRILTCKAGAEELDKLLTQEVTSAFAWFGNKLFAKPAGNTMVDGGLLLKSYLPAAYGYMGAMAGSAEELMRQQIMIYSVMDGIESKSTALGNAQNFALRRAYLQQRTNQDNVAGIAQKTMIALKGVMEAMVYASFIFILPLAMVPYGWRFVGNWAGMVLWVQMWGPLFAILNFIMNAAARSKGMGAITSAGGITIANSVGFSDLHADMAAQAGYLSLSVGALAYALVKGGASSFVNLASHMAGPMTTAAGRATEDLMSGNYSFGNISTGNVQASNQTFGQQMLSPSYSSGAFAQNDGVVASTTSADGTRTVSVANSNLRSSLQWGENLSNTLTEQASQALTASQSSLQAYAVSQAEGYRNALEFGSHMAQQGSFGHGLSHTAQASASSSFSKLDSMVQQFADDNKISKEQAQQLLGKAALTASSNGSLPGKLLNMVGISGELSVSSQLSGTSTSSDLWSKARNFSANASFQEALQQTAQYSQDSRFNQSDETARRLGESAASSFDHARQHRDESQAHLQRSESYSQSAALARQNSTSITASMNQEFVEWLPRQSLPNSNGAMGQREADTILASRPEMLIPYQQRFMEDRFGNLTSGFESHAASSMDKVQSSYEQMKRGLPQGASQDLDSRVMEHAENAGFDSRGFEASIYEQEKDLSSRTQGAIAHTGEQIKQGHQKDISEAGSQLQSINRFEESPDIHHQPGQGTNSSMLDLADNFRKAEEMNRLLKNDVQDIREKIEHQAQPEIDVKKLGIKR